MTARPSPESPLVARFVASPNHGARRGYSRPNCLILHYTGMPTGEAALKALTDPASTGTSSMYRDLQQGRPVEADQIIGDMVARGARHGIATPLLAAAFANLSIYQKQLAKT